MGIITKIYTHLITSWETLFISHKAGNVAWLEVGENRSKVPLLLFLNDMNTTLMSYFTNCEYRDINLVRILVM